MNKNLKFKIAGVVGLLFPLLPFIPGSVYVILATIVFCFLIYVLKDLYNSENEYKAVKAFSFIVICFSVIGIMTGFMIDDSFKYVLSLIMILKALALLILGIKLKSFPQNLFGLVIPLCLIIILFGTCLFLINLLSIFSMLSPELVSLIPSIVGQAIITMSAIFQPTLGFAMGIIFLKAAKSPTMVIPTNKSQG